LSFWSHGNKGSKAFESLESDPTHRGEFLHAGERAVFLSVLDNSFGRTGSDLRQDLQLFGRGRVEVYDDWFFWFSESCFYSFRNLHCGFLDFEIRSSVVQVSLKKCDYDSQEKDCTQNYKRELFFPVECEHRNLRQVLVEPNLSP
jgi:hypothetical protein